MTRIVAFAAVLIAAAVGGVWFLAPGLLGLGGEAAGQGGGPGGGGRAPVVGLGQAAPATFRETIDAVGTAAANESVTITAKVADTVGAINFEEGQSVESGHVIVEMTSAEQAADLRAARAALDEAQKAYDRARDLANRGIAAQARLDEALAARDAARSRLEAIEARLADTIIKAPFAGVLGLRQVSVGSYVRPGDPITTLDDMRLIKADFTVPERFLAVLAPGLAVEVEAAPFPDRKFEGRVASVDSRVNPVTRAVAVRAEIPNEEGVLKPGMLLAVTLVASERTALAVPESAIVPVRDQRFVFLVGADGVAQRVEVKTGLRKPGYVEILSGLNAGDAVVVEGTNKVIPGRPVQAAPPPAPPTAGAATASRPGERS